MAAEFLPLLMFDPWVSGRRQKLVLTLLPWSLSVLVLGNLCWGFWFHPLATWMVVFVSILFCIGISANDFVAGRKMLLYSGVLGLVGIALAIFTGVLLYQRYLKQYFFLRSSRHYENVLPTE